MPVGATRRRCAQCGPSSSMIKAKKCCLTTSTKPSGGGAEGRLEEEALGEAPDDRDSAWTRRRSNDGRNHCLRAHLQ